MSAHTNIEWCDHTFNPWEGCTKVSPGCAHCYAEARNARFGGGTAPNWGPGAPRRRTSAHNWNEPRRWNRLQETSGAVHHGAVRPRVFCASLADWLDAEVPIAWLADLLDLIRETPHLDWLLLTKRPENWAERMIEVLRHNERTGGSPALHAWVLDWIAIDGSARPPANVWLGTTVEDQRMADRRLPALLSIPARVRFLCCEPLLEPVDFLTPVAKAEVSIAGQKVHDWIHWVIVGGESGPGARPCVAEHIWDLVLESARAGVPVFVKQLGRHCHTENLNCLDWPDDTLCLPAGPGAASGQVRLRDPKGGDLAEWPEELRVRQFPR